LKKQKEYDDTVSSLADRLDRVLPFAKQVLEDSVHDDTEILKRIIERMYTLTMDVAEFTCTYVQKNRLSRCFLRHYTSKTDHRAEKTTKSGGYPGDEDRINELKDRLGRLVEDFDRAVGFEALNTVRRNGK
jgi:hypothetical protein